MSEGGRAPRAICPICPHRCTLAEGELGFCRARRACGGIVVGEGGGMIASWALDPVEKKPLACFHPGSMVLSAGGYGCNMRCPFCQNAFIASAGPGDVPTRFVAPDELIEMAAGMGSEGVIGIAFTYNEPFIGYEYVHDCARLAHERGLVVVVVTNGMICEEPLTDILPEIDAMNIDLKGFTEAFYRRCGGDLAAVKRAIVQAAACTTCHVEVTTLIIPGENDGIDEMEALASWLASIDPSIPYHVTRFHPCHKMSDRQPTPPESVRRSASVASRHLERVFVGNCRPVPRRRPLRYNRTDHRGRNAT